MLPDVFKAPGGSRPPRYLFKSGIHDPFTFHLRTVPGPHKRPRSRTAFIRCRTSFGVKTGYGSGNSYPVTAGEALTLRLSNPIGLPMYNGSAAAPVASRFHPPVGNLENMASFASNKGEIVEKKTISSSETGGKRGKIWRKYRIGCESSGSIL